MSGEGKSARWLPIESNPEVMNSFLHKLGVPKTWEINDVFGLDQELLMFLPQPVLSFLLLFPITEKYHQFSKEADEKIAAQTDLSPNLFYMKQTISNACGTVALIHSVANNCGSQGNIKLEENSYLQKFISDSKDKSPDERAEMLENNDAICDVHDEVARAGQTNAPSIEDSVDYHFISFVQVDGDLYELDGRKSGPLKLGKSSPESYLADAAAACKEYMARDPENINFTIVALTAKAD